jgi:hypothetical protein
MTEIRSSHLADSELPMPAQHFELYGRFWDVLSMLIFSFAAATVLIAHASELTWREWGLLDCPLRRDCYIFSASLAPAGPFQTEASLCILLLEFPYGP